MSGKNMLGAYGPWAAARAGKPGAFSFLNPRWRDLVSWKQAARGRLEELLRCPEEVRVSDVWAQGKGVFDGLEVEEVSWQLPFGPRTEAIFLKPEGARGRLPGILAMHDHGGEKYFGKRKITRISPTLHPHLQRHQREYYGGVAWANQIARRGFGVLVHDVFPFESRKIIASQIPGHVVERMMSPPEAIREVTPDDLASAAEVQRYDVPPGEPEERIAAYNAFAAQHEHVVAKSLFCAGLTWPGITVAEDRAALGVLASRADIDPERLAACGLSGGGQRTIYLAGLEDRIRTAVTAGFMTTWNDLLLNTSYTHTWMVYVPGLAGLMDLPEVLGLRAPLPSLVLATTADPLFTREETERAGRTLADVYRKAGALDNFRMSFRPGGHRFDLEMQEEAFSWMERSLA